MRTIEFETIVPVAIDEVWAMFKKVEEYPQIIEYCHKAKLVGGFKEGSNWYDWSTVLIVPLKVNHQIEKILPNAEIIYSIPLPFGVFLKQESKLEGKSSRETNVKMVVTIAFESKLLDSILGNFVEYRNKRMISKTIENFHNRFKNANN